jgi:transposase-like protein
MKRNRRTFTKEFKTEIVGKILNGGDKELLSSQHSISLPLLERWVNDHVAEMRKSAILQFKPTERRRDWKTIEELKDTIIYLTTELQKSKSVSSYEKRA